MDGLYPRLYRAIMQPDPAQKCAQVVGLYDDWQLRRLDRLYDFDGIEDIDRPGRPPLPELVDPRQVARRSLASAEGKCVLLHSFAHIEFNAINLALDAAYRFRDMPDEFVGDWLQVALEESRHFSLLSDYLQDLGSFYGAFDAHNGLWDMVCKTRHDVLHRMALVPRVMEARGLDVTPGMIRKYSAVDDQRAVEILGIIYQEEIGHVAIGNRWYGYCCEQRGVDPRATFRRLIGEYFGGRLRGPFNHQARLAAGFDEDELAELENLL